MDHDDDDDNDLLVCDFIECKFNSNAEVLNRYFVMNRPQCVTRKWCVVGVSRKITVSAIFRV